MILRIKDYGCSYLLNKEFRLINVKFFWNPYRLAISAHKYFCTIHANLSVYIIIYT